MTERERKLRRLHDAIHEQLVYGGYSPGEATELIAEYAATVIAVRHQRHPAPNEPSTYTPPPKPPAQVPNAGVGTSK